MTSLPQAGLPVRSPPATRVRTAIAVTQRGQELKIRTESLASTGPVKRHWEGGQRKEGQLSLTERLLSSYCM